MNLTVILKSTQNIFISNFFDKIPKMGTHNKQIKNIQFFVSPVIFQRVKLRGFDTTATI